MKRRVFCTDTDRQNRALGAFCELDKTAFTFAVKDTIERSVRHFFGWKENDGSSLFDAL